MNQPQTAAGVAAGASKFDLQSLAASEIAKAVSLRPQDVDMCLSLAELELDLGKKREALEDAEEAVHLATGKPSEARARVALGRADFAVGEESRAEEEYKKALALDPAGIDPLLGLGELWLFQRKLLQAEQAFRRAIQVSPQSSRGYAALGEVLDSQGNAGGARNLLEKAVLLDPKDWHSAYLLATLLMGTGEVARATGLIERVLAQRPDYLPAQEILGRTWLRRGDLRRAQDQANMLIARAPQSAEGHRLAALILWKQRDYEGGLAECALALENDPNSAAMQALQAICLWQLDRKKEARAAFVQASKIEPKVGTAEVFCRLLLCDARDIGIVGVFLQKNRWALIPPAPP